MTSKHAELVGVLRSYMIDELADLYRNDEESRKVLDASNAPIQLMVTICDTSRSLYDCDISLVLSAEDLASVKSKGEEQAPEPAPDVPEEPLQIQQNSTEELNGPPPRHLVPPD